jgi:hypothetical protein
MVRAPGVTAPDLGNRRSPAIGIDLPRSRNTAAKAKAVGVDRSGDGLANAVICVVVMLACVVAYLLLARTFMA